MITQKEAELEVLTHLIETAKAFEVNGKYKPKYDKAVAKYVSMLSKRYRTISDKLAPVAGEA